MSEIKYTEEQKERIRAMIKLFRASKKKMARSIGHGHGVCLALRLSAPCLFDYNGVTLGDCLSLIERSIKPALYLTGWQRNNGHEMDGSAETRIAWVNQIIKDLEKAIK